MWLIAAILSSFFAGITSVLAKYEILAYGSCRRLCRHNHADPAKVIAVFNFIRRGCGCVLAFIV